MEMMGRLDKESSVSGDVDFFAQLPSAPTDEFMRISAPIRATHVADDGGPTLTKAELAELVFEHVGLNKREAKDMVEAFFDEVSDALERGESVKLTGFGNFQLRDKVSRPGRNPKTGVQVTIPARRVVTFHASQKLKIVADDSALPDIPGIPGIQEHVDVNDRG
jgi:integration host factor subunit alpha